MILQLGHNVALDGLFSVCSDWDIAVFWADSQRSWNYQRNWKRTNQDQPKIKKRENHDKEEKFVTSDKEVHISVEFIAMQYVSIS